MSHKDRYHFADFTRENYRRLLLLAYEAYPFCSFTDFEKEGRFILWRHDVDFSIQGAVEMARIEAEEGIRVTYFVNAHSGYYNLMEQEVTECVREILAHGHTLGLHFDSHYYGIEREDDLKEPLEREKEILRHLFNQQVSVFSFHNPTPFTASCLRWQYAGMINTYADYFRNQVGYISDSSLLVV